VDSVVGAVANTQRGPTGMQGGMKVWRNAYVVCGS
jgi:hypothetical protein